ncbi:hypothetical protein LHYA1_G007765 [Lachnellula hyalina]|uniref:Uncharacterized protein n=1 Tax=Lachnellula hyalina TaxID=1316788 RepID=A0A8H8QW09_9HELO|nr:uncharacterized protein LHYA1_G007765 [Lachnellula hyalina]TVY23195.1 hypothetical protein LHYA1_G007765 [Lachnellula hyalina]
MPPSLDEDGNDYHGHGDGDTIIVKGEDEWSRPSSQESDMSPELEPLVNHLLSQINPQHLESPEPIEGDIPLINPRIEQIAPKQKPRIVNLTMEERLQMMPEKRPLPWRPGVEAGADNETGGDSRRKQIRFGCLLATRGETQNPPCNSCSNGRGKFDMCVALEGFFKGACASCQLSGRPNRCSIKVNDVRTPAVPLNNETPQQPSSEGPRPKRRRIQTQKKKDSKVPEWESARPQWEQELGDSQARQQLTGMAQRTWAPVNPSSATPQSQIMMNGNGVRSVPIPQNNTGRTNAIPIGWATVNATVDQPSPAPGKARYSTGGDSNGIGYPNSQEQNKREETIMDDGGSGALIDALPKHKQRQVYGLISGLQGGIQHIQRELDSLKRALGIDD